MQPCASFVGVARARIADLAFTLDASDKPLMAVAAGDGSLLIVDLAARSVLTHLPDAHLTADGASHRNFCGLRSKFTCFARLLRVLLLSVLSV